MLPLIMSWLLNALGLMIVAWIVPGFHVANFAMALIAALVIALVNATLGVVLGILTIPLTILSLGLFVIVINALMLKLAAFIVPGFSIQGFLPALVGAVLLALVNMGFRYAVYSPVLTSGNWSRP